MAVSRHSPSQLTPFNCGCRLQGNLNMTTNSRSELATACQLHNVPTSIAYNL